MSIKQAVPLLKKTYSRWSDHNAPRLGASVAFYSILSFAPLLVLITAIIGLVFGHEGAHGALVGEARQVMGNHGAETVDSLLKNAQKPASGTFASVIAFLILLFGASGVFTELQDALNIMWDAQNKQASGFIGMIKQRIFSFGMVLSVGFLLLVSLLLSSGLEYLGHSFSQVLPLPDFVLQILNFVVSFAVITGLFALMFKYVPAVHIDWRDVIIGAIGTALLFTIGKFALGIYLGRGSVTSTYGAAGSLVAVVVWIYYSAQIFFFGAEFTRVYADAQRPKPALAEQNSPQDAVTIDKPKAMAVAAGSFQAPALTAEPFVLSARTAEVPPAPAVATPVSITSPVHIEPRRTIPKPSKPRLLAAAVIGFVLGRIAWTARRR